MKNKLVSGKSLLEEKYGRDGTKSREEFKEKAYSYYLSEILKGRRKELKLTQEELASKIGKQRPYISRVENGEDIRISNFIQIANALGLELKLTTTS